MKASSICIGTEITSGQILNRNSQWISSELKKLGLQVDIHLAVPDNENLILNALSFAFQNSDLLFITGGLGPTSDDFTREVISKWLKTPLEWHEDSWNHVVGTLKSRGLGAKEIQKQQCYFPQGSKILFNPRGTANAFFIKHSNKYLFVLPGPPKEIEGIWNQEIKPWILETFKNIDPLITRSWDTLGLPESEVAEKVVAAIGKNNIEVGYRVHLPYVEVKISYLKSQQSAFKLVLENVDKTLSSHSPLKDGQDISEAIVPLLNTFSKIRIFDEIPHSFLAQRLFPKLKQILDGSKIIEFHLGKKSTNFEYRNSKEKNYLDLTLFENLNAEICYNQFKKSFTPICPFDPVLLKERCEQYAAETAMIFWTESIQTLKEIE